MYWFGKDSKLERDVKLERHNLSAVLDFLKSNGSTVSNWYYGHYHNKHTETIDGTTFHLLDMGRNGKMSESAGGYFDMKEVH